MKKAFLFALMIIGNIQAFNEKEALKSRGVEVWARKAFLSQPESEVEIVTITNNSSKPVLFDPKKIFTYIVKGDRLLQKAWQESRYLSALGAVSMLATAGILPYAMWRSDQRVDKDRKIVERMNDIQEKLKTIDPEHYSSLSPTPFSRQEKVGFVAPFTLFSLLSALAYIGYDEYNLKSSENYSKFLVVDEIFIAPGESRRVLLKFKNQKEDVYSVINQALTQ